jgi:hypothetical protein
MASGLRYVLLALSDKPYATYSERERESEKGTRTGKGIRRGRDKESRL